MNSSAQPRIVYLTPDQAATRLLCSNPETKISAELSGVEGPEQWQTCVKSHHGSIGLLELRSSMPDEQLTRRLNATQQISQNNDCQNIVVAITDAEMSQFSKELLIYGFARVFCSQFEAANFSSLAERHFKHVGWPNLPIEEWVETNLPWRKALC